MKILQVGSNSVHVSSYVKALSETMNDLYLLSEESCDFWGIRKEYQVNFRSLNPSSILRNNKKLKKILLELKPDLIHIHQVNRLAYFVSRIASKLKIPVITTAWGSDVLLIPKQNRFFYFLVQQTLKRSNYITADSEDMIAAMRSMHRSGNYVLVQYGIDPVQSKAKEQIIYSNRLHEPLYRIDQIIRYFEAFAQDHKEWKLVIGAVGSETDTYRKQVQSTGLTNRVEFIGWLEKEQNHDWYARASIYISIPESDGTSVSVLEAMSAGCIPVVSDLPVSHEWIRNGENGVIEQPGVNPLEEALKIDTDQCAQYNRILIEGKATREASLKIFTALYRKAHED